MTCDKKWIYFRNSTRPFGYRLKNTNFWFTLIENEVDAFLNKVEDKRKDVEKKDVLYIFLLLLLEIVIFFKF